MVPKETRLSKINQPQAAGVLLRENLFARLDEGLQKPLVWISSPGGSGKTTLVSSYLANRQLPCLWYQVDGGDLDPATFFYYLGLAGKKAAPRRKKNLPLLTPEYLKGLPEFSRNFFADLFGRLQLPSVIVLDNVQEVPETAPLHQCLIEGLSRIPEGLTIILISRSAPPPAYVRLQANREMGLFNWDDLRLTFQEFEQILTHWHFESLSNESLRDLYIRMDGWAAGLQLLVRHAHSSSPEGVVNWTEAPEEIFAYFADQIFNKFDKDVQNCLLRTAFVSKITLPMAERLSGSRRSAAVLKDLTHQNYFTFKRREAILTYEYHPLFQAFLKETTAQTFPPDEVRDLKFLSAKAFIEESRIEDAIPLLAELQEWQNLIDLILANARQLTDQGRVGTLLAWLDSLPAELVDQHPWLLFWKAAALKTSDIFAARELFKKSYLLFRAQKDPAGTYMAWAGAVDSFIYLWGNFRLLDYWLDEFETLQIDHPEIPTPEIQARVTHSIVGALLWRRSNSPQMQIWSKRGEALFNKTDNPTIKILVGSNLLKYYLWCCGDLAKAERLTDIIQKIDQKLIPPIAIMLSKVIMATYYWFINSMDDCLQTVHEGLNMAENSGIHLMDTALIAHAVYAALMKGDQDQTSRYLKQMVKLSNEDSHLDVAHYHYLYTWQALEQGRLSVAMENARVMIERGEAAGTRQAIAFAHYTLGVVQCELGEYEKAQQAYQKGREYNLSMNNGYFEAAYQLCTALSSLRQGDRDDAAKRVERALAIARQQGYTTIPWIGWYRKAFTEMMQLALEYGLETEYACVLIKEHQLFPETPPTHLECWPWSVKIHALGGFSIDTDSASRSSRKIEKRPMELLKTILAAGPGGILIDQAVDQLVPDKDGKSAYNIFSVTLHRLRQRLGDEKFLLTDNGRLTINPCYCWVDAWQFARLSPKGQHRISGNANSTQQAEPLDQAIALYRGEFLGGQTDTTNQLIYAEELARRFAHTIFARARLAEEKGRWEKAVETYHRGLQQLPQHEPFFRAIMFCYDQFGYTDGIHQTYQQCQKSLSRSLDISPSDETEKLYSKLLG